MTVKRLAQVICLVLLALTVGACGRDTPTPTPTDTPTPVVDTPTPTPVRAADLSADRARVQCRHPGQAVEEVVVGDHEPVGPGDEINTDENGLGILTFPDFLRVEIFRQTGLQVKAAPDPDAPPIVKLYLALGTTLQELQKRAGERVVVSTETDWATITAVSTTYLVSVDEDGVTSVVVYEGEAKVEAQLKTVTVKPGQATYVEPRKAPQPPTDTEMSDVNDWVSGAREAEDVGSIKPVIFPPAVTPTSTSTPTPIRTPTSTPTPKPADVDITVAQDHPPVVKGVDVEPATIYQGDEFRIKLTASDDLGLQSIRWRIEGTGDKYFDQGDEADCGGITRCERSWDLKWAGEDGQFTIYAQARDTAGQLSSIGSTTINVLPTATFSLSIGGGPFNDKSVQVAVGFAIDWAALRDEVGGVTLVDFLSGDTLAGPTEPAYDPERAKEILEEAGYDRFDAMLLFDRNDELAASVAELVTSYLYEVKIYAKYLLVASADARTKFAATIAAGESGLLVERR